MAKAKKTEDDQNQYQLKKAPPKAVADTRVRDVLPNYAGYEEEDHVDAPYGFDDEDDFLKDMRDEYQLDIDHELWNRQELLEDKKFLAGEQWDPAVLQQRMGLPCLVINMVPQFIAQIAGDWRENRRGIKVLPNDDEQTDLADVRGDLIRAIETKSRAWEVYDQAFEEMVACGDADIQICVDYARDDVFDQDIFIRPVEDCLDVVWDRFSTEITGRDARHVFKNVEIPRKEFEKKYPEADPSTLGRELKAELTASGWVTTDAVRVTEYWRLIEKDQLLALFADGSVRFLEDDDDEGQTDNTTNDVSELIQAHGKILKTRVAPITYAEMYLTTGFKILAGPYSYRLNRLPIIRMTGRTVTLADKRVRYGLIRFMKDAVRLRNFWRSVAAEQLGYAPKAQWIAPESAVEGREDNFRRAHLTRDPLIVYNDGAEVPPQRLEPPPIQAALLNEAQINTQDMKDVTGMQDASLGMKGNETSGRAIMARQQEGDISALTYYDNGNAAVREAGDVINQLISQVYDGTRIIRTIGEDEAIKFLKINDPNDPSSPDLSVGWFDTVLTTGAAFTTRRMAAAEAMMEAIQVWPQLIQVAGDLVAQAQDWPGAEELAERLRKTIPPQYLDDPSQSAQPQIDPQQLAQFQQEFQKMQMENAALKQNHDLEAAKVQNEAYRVHTERLKVLGGLEKDHIAAQHNAQQMDQQQSQFIQDQERQAQELYYQTKAQQQEAQLRAQGTPKPIEG